MKKLSLKELLTLTMLGALLCLSKWVLQWLPNIELVSLLLMVYTYKFGLKTLVPVYVFVGLEMLLYGVNIWNVMYLYVWALLILAVYPFRKIRRGWVFALISGGFGGLFGTLCAVSYVFTLGWEFALSWILSGLPYDGIHAVGNFVAAMALYMPLTRAMDRIKIK